VGAQIDALEAARGRIDEIPNSRIHETSDSIEVTPAEPSGFSVRLNIKDGGYVVHMGGWHEHFDTAEEALNCFSFGLSSSCRLRVEFHGSRPTRWRMEAERDGDWIPDSETGALLVPFWRQRRIGVFRNRQASGGVAA
jgi:hypothetical protein